jgi:hypothetical protein
MAGFDLKDYVDVKTRATMFYEKYPDGRIASSTPVVVEIGDQKFIEVTASVWRSPEDPIPCVASAWEIFPGKSSFTKNSEMMNAETSAIGRALFAAGIATSSGVASAEEVRNRKAEKPKNPPATNRDIESDVVRKSPIDVISSRLANLPDSVRAAAKEAFMAEFGKPAEMDRGRYAEAQQFVTGWETQIPA